MIHTLRMVASSNFVDYNKLFDFATTGDNFNKYHLSLSGMELMISTWFVDDLLKAYKEDHAERYRRRVMSAKYLGYTEPKVIIHWFHLQECGASYGVELSGNKSRYLDERLLELDPSWPEEKDIINILKEAMLNTGKGES